MAHDFKKFPELTNNQMQIYYFESPHKQITEDFKARVVDVHDGDTIKVEVDFRDFNFPVRFLGTAAPELDEVGGKEAQSWLEELILGEEVDIVVDNYNRVGKWGRLLGVIKLMGIDINQKSMDEGFAVSFESLENLWK